MKKYNNQKGQDLIEYALMLAIVVGIGSFIYSGTGMRDSISSIFGNTSNLLGVAASDAVNPSKDVVDDRNMKWLKEKFFGYTTDKDINFAGYLKGTQNKRNSLEFSITNQNGIFDSGAGTDFVGKIESSDLGKNASWTFAGYTDENGQTYYGVSIYDPAKNGNKTLSEQDVGATITTDIYRVDTNGNVEKVKNNAQQTAYSRTDPIRKTTYTVIRDIPK